MANERYFNFPIELLRGFMIQPRIALNDIFDYALFRKSESYDLPTNGENFEAACSYFGVKPGDKNKCWKNGSDLYWRYKGKAVPITGLNKNVWFDYYQNEKTEFELICLLGFLAFKSILGKKKLVKVTNKFWFARIAGFANPLNSFEELSPAFCQYTKEYWTVKIKRELTQSWGLVTYSQYNKGFYVSFTLTLDELAYEAEKTKKAYKDKAHKTLQKDARTKALERLENHLNGKDHEHDHEHDL